MHNASKSLCSYNYKIILYNTVYGMTLAVSNFCRAINRCIDPNYTFLCGIDIAIRTDHTYI